MEKKEQLWERLAPIVVEREEGFGNITVGGATDQQGKDNLLDFIQQELDKAREEGRKALVKEIREAIRRDINKDCSVESRHIAIDEDIVRIINDGEITEMYLDGEEELIDGGWGWYS